MQTTVATSTDHSDGLVQRVFALIATLAVLAGLAVSPGQQAAAAQVIDDGAERLVSVVVRAAGGGDAATKAVETVDGSVTQRLDIVGGVAAEVPASSVDDLTLDPAVLSVTEDTGVELLAKPSVGDGGTNAATLAHIQKVIGARPSDRGLNDGTGIGVALIDTGVAMVAGLENVQAGPSVGGGGALRDGYGHGTHLAGIISGNEKVAGGFSGISPDATTISVRASNDEGATSLVSVISALDWAVQHKADKNIRVLNLSLGVPASASYTRELLAVAVEAAWKAGIVVVVAAGNDGELAGSPLTSPATDPYVIAVGAVATQDSDSPTDDVVAPYSPRGSAERRVDVVAPGKSVVSLKSPGSHAATSYPNALIGDRYIKGSGTSQSAAVVTGVVASLLEARPQLTPDEVKAVLKASATPLKTNDPGQGAGMVSLPRALSWPVPANATQTWTPASVTPGTAPEAPVIPPPPGETTCEHDINLGPPAPPAADGSSTACGWSGGTWSADGTFTGGTWSGGTWSGGTWSGGTWSGGTWSGGTWSGGTWSAGTWAGGTWSADGGWSGGTWSGGTWSGGTWSGGTWSGGTWSGGTWSGGTWSGGTWSGGTWSGGTWSGGTWSGGTWSGATWSGGTWSGGTWSGGTWSGGTWSGGTWSGGTWSGGTWSGGTWSGGTWSGGTWSGGTWSGGTWSCGTWSGATWSGGTWSGGTWSGGTWSGGTWSGGTWSGGTWSGATWAGGTWSGGTWSGGTWSGSLWSGGTWSGGSWSGAQWNADAWSGAAWAGTTWS